MVFIRRFGPTFFCVSDLRISILMCFFRFVVLEFQFRVTRCSAIRGRLAIIQDVTRVATVDRMTFANFLIVIMRQLICPIPSYTTARRINQFSDFPMIRRIATNIAREIDVFQGIRQVFSIVITFRDATRPTSKEVLIKARVSSVIIAFVLGET